ncbi:MAG: HlyD family type I secretion periplasmic adaptor subunit [Pseudomonadota bacterium]
MTQALDHPSVARKKARPLRKRLAEGLAGLLAPRPGKYLARAVMLEESGPPRAVLFTIVICAGLVFAFLIWAAVVKLEEKTAAPGEILPINFVQPVQHLEGGIVARVMVRDGDRVAAGQPLVALDGTAFLADLARMRARHASLAFQEKRLRAFARDGDLDFSALAEDYDGLKDDQAAIFQSQIRGRDAQLEVVRNQIAEQHKELDGLKTQEEMLKAQVALIAEEVALRGQLVEKGLSSKLVYLASKRELNRTQTQLAQVVSNQARTSAMLAEAQSRYLELENRLRGEALAELGTIASERLEVAEEVKRLEDRVARLVVTAPVAGTVKGLAIKAVGAVLPPGALIAEMVPDEGALVAEVRISPRDIGHVKVGKPAIVKVATYDFGRYGGIPGTLDYVSAATFLDAEGNPYFRGRVLLERNYVGPKAAHYLVAPGMTLIADIKTGEKSLLGYLVRPVYNALDTAFSER